MVVHKCNKEVELQQIKDDVKYIRESIDRICLESKQNTEFRLESKGVIGAISFVSAVFGGLILWVMTKIWK